MKTKTCIFLFFLIISNFGFGQIDTLLLRKGFEKHLRFLSSECAHSHICCNVGCDCCIEIPPPFLNIYPAETSIDTIAFYDTKVVNSYILNKSEKDSIYKSYIKKNRKFLKPYRKRSEERR